MIASPVIGHRGAAALAPENTLAGIRMAAECGLSWVELDVTLLGDHTPVLCHDDQLDRISNRKGPLALLTAIDLPGLDAGSWFNPSWANEPMPRLADALLLCQELGLGLNLEIKPYGANPDLIANRVFEEISVYWQQPEKLIISCFDLDVLAAYRQLDNKAQLGLLFEHLPDLWQLHAQSLQAVSIHCDHTLVTPEDIQRVKSAGLAFYCYTCNDPDRAKHLLQQGVDGLFTDNPTLFSDLLSTQFSQPA